MTEYPLSQTPDSSNLSSILEQIENAAAK